MKTHIHSASRLLGRLLLFMGLLIGLGLLTGGLATPAHAATNLTVTDCSNDSQLQADISTANSDNDGDTITFSCSGDIKLTSALTISGSMTLDGSGQSVTLDGGDTEGGIYVHSGVHFTLNALTIAHGYGFKCVCGGIYNGGGTVNITNSTFAYNAILYGGAGFGQTSGTANISNSTFINNSNSDGIASQGGTVNISNSTFANNSGGIVSQNDTVNISNSTFANNKEFGIDNYGSTMSISNSIVANNTLGNCDGGETDLGYNLSSDSSCGFTGTGDLQNTDPKLDSNGLQNNGGPTQTIALQQDSPAIDQIPAASCPATDQRGVTRPDDGEAACDMGAYESDYVDNDLALTNMPGNITTDASSPQGAVVTYTPPTVVDEDSPLPTANCSPASGSTFAIGTTTVTCMVSDSDDSNSPVSQGFTVTVNGAATQISNLITTVNGFHFKKAIQGTLDAELQVALTAVNQGKTKVACASLDLFIGEVKLLTGHGITSSQASQLVAAATQIRNVLGC
ncbi:MAG TPA: right-handed parallel beta-helix repeat-containing protein [Ktedonobacteraceae bacterium]|nr:right-handed parallel beta-helix repeat-containing protein [Ktedonobacteraceae bacterium]